MQHLKLLLVIVAVAMGVFATWLMVEAVRLHWQDDAAEETVELPQPSADLSAEDVVRLQLEALQNNDELDAGIAAAFNFASPDNRKNYDRPAPRESKAAVTDEVLKAQQRAQLRGFARMLKHPFNRFILNHKAAEFGPLFVQGDETRQVVTLTSSDGEEVDVLFVVRRQTQPPFEGCWMTEAVEILNRRHPPPARDEPVVGA